MSGPRIDDIPTRDVVIYDKEPYYTSRDTRTGFRGDVTDPETGYISGVVAQGAALHSGCQDVPFSVEAYASDGTRVERDVRALLQTLNLDTKWEPDVRKYERCYDSELTWSLGWFFVRLIHVFPHATSDLVTREELRKREALWIEARVVKKEK